LKGDGAGREVLHGTTAFHSASWQAGGILRHLKPLASGQRPLQDDLATTRRRSQIERRQDAEQRLVASAIELIGRKGVRALTLNAVGVRAGYSRGLVTHHYGSRGAFMAVVVEHLRQRFREAERRGDHEPGLQTLLATVRQYLTGSGPAGRAMSVLLTEALVARGPLLETMREFSQGSRQFLAQHIRIGMERGEIREDVDPEAAATMILGMLRGVGAQVLLDHERVTIDRMLGEVVKAVRRLMEPQGE
jgi:AcrR family transcriptional regulator